MTKTAIRMTSEQSILDFYEAFSNCDAESLVNRLRAYATPEALAALTAWRI